MKRKVKLRVKIFCALGAVYFLFVLCMTVYAQTTHINALPTVTLMRVEDGVVPREAVYGNRQRGYRVYTVKQEDGAFGKAYFLCCGIGKDLFDRAGRQSAHRCIAPRNEPRGV